jgi:hypothetical protein
MAASTLPALTRIMTDPRRSAVTTPDPALEASTRAIAWSLDAH